MPGNRSNLSSNMENRAARLACEFCMTCDAGLLDSEEAQTCFEQLRARASSPDLLFGEVFLMAAAERRKKLAPAGLANLLRAARDLFPLFDVPLRDITRENLNDILQGDGQTRRQQVRSWLRFINKLEDLPCKLDLPSDRYAGTYSLSQRSNSELPEECNPLVFRVFRDLELLNTRETEEYCEKLRERSVSGDLLFGETVLLVASEVEGDCSDSAFRYKWRETASLLPLFNRYVGDIEDEEVDSLIRELPRHRINHVKAIVNLVRQSPYSAHGAEREFRLANLNYPSFCRSEYPAPVHCHAFTVRALYDRNLFENTAELEQCCEELLGVEETLERELLFGEVLFLEAVNSRKTIQRSFFNKIWSNAALLIALWDKPMNEVGEEVVSAALEKLPPYRVSGARRWYNAAVKSEHNPHRPEPGYALTNGRRSAFLDYYQDLYASLSFADDYVLPRYAHFSTVFKYWLWLSKDRYSERSIMVYCMGYNTLKPLHEIPYRNIRPEDILRCVAGHPVAYKNRAIYLYHGMDKLAYEKDIIPRLYSAQISPFPRRRKVPKLFLQSEIENILANTGSIEADVTAVLLYTGLTPLEAGLLTGNDLDDRYVHIPSGRTTYQGRNIPLRSEIRECARHVAAYMEEHDTYRTDETRLIIAIKVMVKKATKNYCERVYSPWDCRDSFAARLQEAGATGIMVERLLGLKYSRYMSVYSHPSAERIEKVVMRMA